MFAKQSPCTQGGGVLRSRTLPIPQFWRESHGVLPRIAGQIIAFGNRVLILATLEIGAEQYHGCCLSNLGSTRHTRSFKFLDDVHA